MVARRVVVHVAPHPDDEALGAPAALLGLRDAGWEVVDLVVTLGSPAHHERRRAEATAAAARAGYRLVVPEPPISEASELAASEARVTDLVADVVADTGAALVVSPSPHDGHPDHEVVGRAVAASLSRATSPPVWWMWGLWADLPFATLFVPEDERTMDEALAILDAYAGELERNDYRRLLRARAEMNAVLGAERVFGFGAAGHDAPYAELLSEVVLDDGQHLLGTPRVVDFDQPLVAPTSRSITHWLLGPSLGANLR